MAKYNIDLVQVFRDAFNIGITATFLAVRPDQATALPKYGGIEVIQDDQSRARDEVLGNPVMERVILKNEDDPEFEPLELPLALIDVRGGTEIIKTEISGRKGTVKEAFQVQDEQVRIRGLIINHESDEYPAAEVRNLKRVCEAMIAYQVESDLLNELGIDNLVIESYEFIDVEGYPSVQPYVLNCLSDQPFELKKREETEKIPAGL